MVTEVVAALGQTLLVWAHPDDETYLSGGTAAALVDAGLPPIAVTATRGEGGGPDPSPQGRAETARIRTAELHEALEALGVGEHHWLGYEDGRCAEADAGTAARLVANVVDQSLPDTVITFGPDGFTGHPDHQAVSGWVTLALRRASHRPRLLHAVTTHEDRVMPEIDSGFGVFELGHPRYCEPEELALRHVLEPRTLERKLTALQAQASQTSGLIDAVGLDRYSAWVAVESFAEPAGGGPG